MQTPLVNLSFLKYSTGYNIPLNTSDKEIEALYVGVFELSRLYFWSNFNLSFILYGLPFIVSIFLALANKIV